MSSTSTAPTDTILDRMPAVSDPLRCRILILLERQELSVSELCATLQSPQSTVSRHLKLLANDGWIIARRNGTSRLYSALPSDTEAVAVLWQLVRHELAETAAAEEDARRLEAVLAQRASGSKSFFSSAADRWAEMRQELFGRRFDLSALLGLLDDDLIVGDLGVGTGQVVESLAPHVRKVVAVDESPEMLQAAAERLAGFANVELRHGKLEELPIDDSSLDVALLFLVLHHLAEPHRVFREVARVLKDDGKFLIVDMLPHDREEYRAEMGHVWMGFDESQLAAWFDDFGFQTPRVVPLTPEPKMLGPTLFAAVGVKRRRDQSFSTAATGNIVARTTGESRAAAAATPKEKT